MPTLPTHWARSPQGAPPSSSASAPERWLSRQKSPPFSRHSEKTPSSTQAGRGGLNRLCFVACGPSWHAALVGKYLVEAFARLPVDVDIASEFRYRRPVLDSRVLTVPISQSGETADTLAALREARDQGSRAIAICNVVGSSLARDADGVVYTRAGIEISVASTKAFTAQLVAVTLLALKHGPIALIDSRMPVVAIIPKGATYDKMMSNVDEVKARDGIVIAVATEGDEDIRAKADLMIPVPPSLEWLQPLLLAAPLQLLAYHLGVLRGCDVDQPRNLAKSVTVE